MNFGQLPTLNGNVNGGMTLPGFNMNGLQPLNPAPMNQALPTMGSAQVNPLGGIAGLPNIGTPNLQQPMQTQQPQQLLGQPQALQGLQGLPSLPSMVAPAPAQQVQMSGQVMDLTQMNQAPQVQFPNMQQMGMTQPLLPANVPAPIGTAPAQAPFQVQAAQPDLMQMNQIPQPVNPMNVPVGLPDMSGMSQMMQPVQQQQQLPPMIQMSQQPLPTVQMNQQPLPTAVPQQLVDMNTTQSFQQQAPPAVNSQPLVFNAPPAVNSQPLVFDTQPAQIQLNTQPAPIQVNVQPLPTVQGQLPSVTNPQVIGQIAVVPINTFDVGATSSTTAAAEKPKELSLMEKFAQVQGSGVYVTLDMTQSTAYIPGHGFIMLHLKL